MNPEGNVGNELVLWDSVKRAIAECHKVDEIKQIRDKAEVYRYALKLAGEAPAVVRQAEEIKLRAERRAGELLREQPKADGGHRWSRSEPTTETTYAEQGIDKRDASIWQRIAEIPRERFEQFIAEAPEITTAGALRLAKGNVHFSSQTDEWTTPPEIIDMVVEVLGAVDLDPCADSNDTIPAAIHQHEEQNGRGETWRGRVYMNPPYGEVISTWVNKLIAEYECGNVTAAIALVPARTDTRWFPHEYPVCFVMGRLKFGGQDNCAPFPSALFYLGRDVKRFKKVFQRIAWFPNEAAHEQ